jgi:hypothetical protein
MTCEVHGLVNACSGKQKLEKEKEPKTRNKKDAE